MKQTKKKQLIDNIITYGLVVAFWAVIQILTASGNLSNQLKGLLVPLCVYVILAVSLNLVVGISGELSLGHAGFMCVGAFSGAFFSKLMAESIASDTLRLAIVTLAFGEIIKNVLNVLYVGSDANGIHVAMSKKALNLLDEGQVIIEGAKGIAKTPRASNFNIGIVLVLITLFIVLNLIHSRTGRAIMSIRDNRIAAESVGINITKYKLLAFTVSASLAGVGGVLYAHNYASLAGGTFDYNMSILILVYVVLGGIGNIRGSMIAAVVLTALPELLRSFSNYRMLIYAIVLIAMMLFTSAPGAIAFRERLVENFRGHRNKEVA